MPVVASLGREADSYSQASTARPTSAAMKAAVVVSNIHQSTFRSGGGLSPFPTREISEGFGPFSIHASCAAWSDAGALFDSCARRIGCTEMGA